MSSHPSIITTVDVVVLTIGPEGLSVLLNTRTREPFEGRLALPGGYVRADEDASADAAAFRVLRDKVGVSDVHIEQLATFSGAQRDPRGYSLTVAYVALVPLSAIPEGASLHPVREVRGLAFDHDTILGAAVDRLRSKSSYSSAPAALLEKPFTLPELYAAYADVLGVSPDPSSFRRKVLAVGAITPSGEKRGSGGRGKGRAAETYVLPRGEVRTFDITFKSR